MNKPVLTIAVPTYNRPELLKRTLKVILPQVASNEQVCILILDNHSDIPASEVLGSLETNISPDRVRVIRNNVNIGASANVMRCFEFCETNWIWVLSDDDAPSSNAIEIILSDISLDPAFIYYTVPSIRKPVFDFTDKDFVQGDLFDGLLNRFDGSIGRLAFLSAAIFNMSYIRSHILEGYLVVNTGIPHLVMLSKALARAECQWMISRKTIADYQTPDQSQSWGFLYIAYSMPALFSIAGSLGEVNSMRKSFIQGWRFSPKKILFSLLSFHQLEGAPALLVKQYCFMKRVFCPNIFDDFSLWFRWNLSVIWAVLPRLFIKVHGEKRKKSGVMGVNQDRR